MTRRRVEITIQKDFRPLLSRTRLRKAALSALDAAIPRQTCQLSLAICDDDTIRQLNRDYRGVDEVTDVLAFSSHYPGPWQGDDAPPADRTSGQEPFVMPVDEAAFIGEAVVCYPQMCRQAAESSTPPENELALLVVHGVLHLLGYDHQEPSEQADMEARQQQALSRIL